MSYNKMVNIRRLGAYRIFPRSFSHTRLGLRPHPVLKTRASSTYRLPKLTEFCRVDKCRCTPLPTMDRVYMEIRQLTPFSPRSLTREKKKMTDIRKSRMNAFWFGEMKVRIGPLWL